MRYQDISTDTELLYRLGAHERAVFFMLNRSGEITIELAGPGATAHIFAFYTSKDSMKHSLNLTQTHLAPDTTSSALVKSALSGQSTFSYTGTIAILKEAHRSDAAQESRALLLSPEARAYARPALEILAHDVACRHAATMSPVNDEALFLAMSRGLSRDAACRLFVQGFFQEALERMGTLGVNSSALKKATLSPVFVYSNE